MDLNVFQMLDHINKRLSNIEHNISRIDEKIDFSLSLQRNHLIRVKNGEDLDDSMILMGQPYNDLSPKQAYQIYENKDADYILLDVSESSFTPSVELRGVVKIPYEELQSRYSEIAHRTLPILIISEDGLRSILACELFIKKGYFNVNNISGGYTFWPEVKMKSSEKSF